MKSFIVLALFVAAAVAAPAGPGGPDAEAQILRFDNDNIGVDGYSYGYETSNGISASEQGVLKNAGTENESLQSQGQFAYTGPDGVLYQITYTADEEGFRASGAHIPVAP